MLTVILNLLKFDAPPTLDTTRKSSLSSRAMISSGRGQQSRISDFAPELLTRVFELGAEIEDDNVECM